VQYCWTQTLCFTEWKWQQIALSEAEVEPGAASGTHSFKDIDSKLNTAARCHIVWQRPNSRIININSLYTWATEAILAVSLRCIVGVCECSQLMSHDMHAHVACTLTLKNTHTHTYKAFTWQMASKGNLPDNGYHMQQSDAATIALEKKVNEKLPKSWNLFKTAIIYSKQS